MNREQWLESLKIKIARAESELDQDRQYVDDLEEALSNQRVTVEDEERDLKILKTLYQLVEDGEIELP